MFGERLRRMRLWRNADQLTTAANAGISERALRNLEAGRGSTVETLLRYLKGLDALECVDTLAPEPSVNPMLLLRTHSAPQRVRRPRWRKAIRARAEKVLGDPNKAEQWLNSPNRNLAGLTPLEMLRYEDGPDRVDKLLERMELGNC